MVKKKQKNKQRQIGKTKIDKKPLIDQKHKNTFWTILIILILLIFFIVNNTGEEPKEGPYPPGYPQSGSQTDSLN